MYVYAPKLMNNNYFESEDAYVTLRKDKTRVPKNGYACVIIPIKQGKGGVRLAAESSLVPRLSPRTSVDAWVEPLDNKN